MSDVALAYLSLDDMLDALLERVRDALEADTCAILLLDEEHDELVARAAKGIEEELERGVRIPVGKGFAGRIAAQRRPVAIEDVDHAGVLNPTLREKGIKSLLGAPLLARERVLGVVHVGTLTRRRFTEEDAELLELVADRVALGLERALVHEELLLLDSLKREFVATAAHEIRAPATVIYGIAKTLAERKESLDPATLGELVDAFYDSSMRLVQLTDDLLDFSRLETTTAALAVEPLSLRRLIEELTSGLSTKPREDIEIEIPEDLVLVSDRSALERILGNLVRNSLVHGAPPVTIRASQAAAEARISVEDRGPGIPIAFTSRLFEAFARPQEAREKPGAGLGLAIAHSYARRLGGDLLYEPAKPTGAIFTLVLPRRAA
ncbi:MAG TPA: GAF domain-containing protein [Gaiellaceae bacterium]